MKNIKTLAEFISTTREKIGYSQKGLADRANLNIEIIEAVESGQDLFLSSTVRQKIAKVLRLDLFQLKALEREPQVVKELDLDYIEELKLRILEGQISGNICPSCKSELICKIVEMYDLENRIVKHPKARCSKCYFQIK